MGAISKIVARSEIAALLSRPTWTVHDLVDHAAPLVDPPSDQHLQRLSQLAGLDMPSPAMLESFRNQLKFVETLRNVNTEGVAPVARLVPDVEVPSLEDALESTATESELGHWNPVDLASEKKGDFYVVRDTLHNES